MPPIDPNSDSVAPSSRTPDRIGLAKQLAATSEILRLVGSSRHDEAPVFAAILKQSQSLCNAPMAGLVLGTVEYDTMQLAAMEGFAPHAVKLFETGQMKMDGTLSYAALCIQTAEVIVWPDMGKSDLYEAGSPIVRSMVDDSGIHSVAFVPLIHGTEAIGLITLFRKEINPFSKDEIALVETFAAKAVIAMENVRQFKELQTRLAREAATREVLQVIS